MGRFSHALTAILTAGMLVGTPLATADVVRPDLTLWKAIKQALLSDRGQKYFEENFEGAFVPGGANGVSMFRATVLSAKPAQAPSVLVISIVDKSTPEVTLRLQENLRRRVEPGSDVWFEGVPVSFSKDPFMVTFDVSVDKVKFERPPAR